MSARAMWKAKVRLEDIRIPVKLYAAVADAKVHFRLLHAKDHVPVKQQMVDPATDEPVAPEGESRARKHKKHQSTSGRRASSKSAHGSRARRRTTDGTSRRP